jgi:ribonuclease P protein component
VFTPHGGVDEFFYEFTVSDCTKVETGTVIPSVSMGTEPVMSNQETYPKCERLTKRAEYLDVYDKGERFMNSAFICFIVRTGSNRKFGLAVSRKVGGAVQRNRVKRFIREMYRTSRKAMSDQNHVVIIARPKAATLDYHQSRNAIAQLFQRGELYAK